MPEPPAPPPTGGGHTVSPPDPVPKKKKDPPIDPWDPVFPEGDGIPEILEEKLDVIMFLLAGIWRLLVQIALILLFGFNAVIACLIAINFNLGWLGALIAGLLSLILFFLLFIVIRLVVPLLRLLHW
jgi:hypothetical protein